MEYMKYKDYYGTVECSLDDDILFGKVIGIRGAITYEGSTVQELKNDFHDVIDTYLSDCEKMGTEPQKSYKGKFNVRINPELHRKLAVYAKQHNESMNSSVEHAIKLLVE